MNSICLSLAPNLRCQDLTRIQSIIIFIPAAVEAFFSLVLALADSSLRGRKRWILVCDGLSFFILALLDFLAHFISGISTSQTVFSAIDFALATTSFIPILAYLLFLVLFAKSNLARSIPSRFRRILTISLSLVIPLTITFNELGSLLGISHKNVATAGESPFLAATLFTLAFVRVVRAFIDERRVEDDSRHRHEHAEQIYLFRGLGWLSVGLKLGAIESVVGFADTSFAVVLTRRLLRLFGRGAVIIGVIKGLNIVEDFVQFEADVRTIRSESTRTNNSSRQEILPTSRPLISNPRASTFHQLSPNATSFHAAQLEKRTRKPGPASLVLGANSTFNRFNSQLRSDLNLSTQSQRVTVHWDGRAAPVLDVRFSTLDFPLPANVLSKTTRTSLSAIEELSKRISETSEKEMVSSDRSTLSSNSSMGRRASDSLSEAVRDLASRFPSLPAHAKTPTSTHSHLPSHVQSRESLHSNWMTSIDVRRSISDMKLSKQVVPSTSFDSLLRNQNINSRFSVSTYAVDEGDNYCESFDDTTQKNQSPLTTPGLSSVPTTNTVATSGSSTSHRLELTLSSELSRRVTADSFQKSGDTKIRDFGILRNIPPLTQEWSYEAGPYTVPMRRQSPDIGYTENITDYAWKRAGLARVKSISPARMTPPATMSPMRRSVYAVGGGETFISES